MHTSAPHPILRRLALPAALALALAACGDDPGEVVDDPAAGESEEEPADEPEEEPADEPEEAADGGVAVSSTDLGDVLVDAEGMTLYAFDPDEQGASTCVDDCAANWPPLVTDGEPEAGEGIDEALLGTSERDDGEMQVTYDDWPLYRWANDESPGDTTGQGVEEVWWVVADDGTPVRDAPEQDEDDEEESIGGY